MQIAFLSDIHGNSQALEAVLKDIDAAGGADAYWLLGDFAAIGPDPLYVLERITRLPNLTLLRGNTDRYLVSGERPHPRQEDLEKNPGLVDLFKTIDASFTWTKNQLSGNGWLDWADRLPLEQRMTLPDGTRLLAVHAAPGKDDGPGIPPTISDEALAESVAPADADLIMVGHTHWPMDRRVNGTRVVNLGSLSNPFPPDLRSSYVLLQANSQGYQIQHRRVDYDHQAVIDRTLQLGHPAAEYIIHYITGQNKPNWEAK
jgi:predicted phosphodiesterase